MTRDYCAGGQSATPEPTRRVAVNSQSYGAARTCHPIGCRRSGLRVLYDVKIKEKGHLK